MDSVTDDVLTVTLGGKEYPLLFPIEAIRKAKKKFGSLSKMLATDSDDMMPELIAAGVSHPDITEEWIVSNVSFPALLRQQGKVIAAFTGKTKTEYEAELAEKKEDEASAKKARVQAIS